MDIKIHTSNLSWPPSATMFVLGVPAEPNVVSIFREADSLPRTSFSESRGIPTISLWNKFADIQRSRLVSSKVVRSNGDANGRAVSSAIVYTTMYDPEGNLDTNLASPDNVRRKLGTGWQCIILHEPLRPCKYLRLVFIPTVVYSPTGPMCDFRGPFCNKACTCVFLRTRGRTAHSGSERCGSL